MGSILAAITPVKMFFLVMSSHLNNCQRVEKKVMCFFFFFWQPLIHNQLTAQEKEQKYHCFQQQMGASKWLCFPTTPAEKKTKNPTKHPFWYSEWITETIWVMKWIMEGRESGPGRLYGFLSNYKGGLDRKSAAFHPQPWRGGDKQP